MINTVIDTVARAFAVAATLAVPLRAQCPDGTPPPCGRAARPAAKSLAILPFEAVGGDTANQYFAEGLSDELMAVPLTPGSVLTMGSPRELFPVAAYRAARNRPEYDVAPTAGIF